MAFHKIVTKLPEYSCAYIAVPAVFANAYLYKIETNNGSACFNNPSYKVHGFFCLQATQYRCAGSRTKFWIEPVDIKTDMHFFWQMVYNGIGNTVPVLTIVK